MLFRFPLNLITQPLVKRHWLDTSRCAKQLRILIITRITAFSD